jgi:hypothetical protein
MLRKSRGHQSQTQRCELNRFKHSRVT